MMTETQTWTDGDCVECGRETRINGDELCLVCEDDRKEQAQREQLDSIRETIRDEFEGQIVVGKGVGTIQRFHVPKIESDEDEPLCHSPDGNGWLEKPLDGYPEGHKDWCHRCIRVLTLGEEYR